MVLIKKQAATGLIVGIAVAGGVLSPVIASAATDSSTVSATVAPVISVTSNGTVPISVTPTGSGAEATGTDTVTVNSNNPTGYNLTLNDSDATLTMVGSNGGTLAATSGTYAAPAALDMNSWGYNLDASANYTGVSATAQNIASTTAVSGAGGDDVSVTYGVKVDTSVPAGTYTDAVTYTATVK